MICNPLGKIDCFGKSLKHPKFERNSDRFVIADIRPSLCIHSSSDVNSDSSRYFGPSQGQLLVVADGVGERNAASRASALAVDTVNTHLLNAFTAPASDAADYEDKSLFDQFSEAIDECRQAMEQEVEAADRFDEMGAVLTLVYVVWPDAYVMHIGNNRAYHFQRQHIDQITNDHTMARRLIDAGKMASHREPESHLRNVVWNLIGTQTSNSRPEFAEKELAVGDALVLCSDGMINAVTEKQIAEALQKTNTAEQTCEHLFLLAEKKGFKDDATVVVARFADREMAATAREIIDERQMQQQVKPNADKVLGKGLDNGVALKKTVAN